MENTKIEWCDDTVNPWIGCAKVSQACTNCYAESLDKRLRFGGQTNWGAGGNRLIRVDKAIAELHRIAKRGDKEGRPRKVFIASMADVFEDRADLVEPRAKLWAALCEINRGRTRLVALLLTKRIEVALDFQRAHVPDGLPSWAWIGCTVENQEAADERIPVLCDIAVKPGGVRFLSMEPMLGAVNLHRIMTEVGDFSALRTGRIGWVIAGGESGPKARPSHPDWFRSLRDQCATVGVPFHFKQWGEWAPHETWVDGTGWTWPGDADYPQDAPLARVGKKAAGRLLDGVEHNGVPSVSP